MALKKMHWKRGVYVPRGRGLPDRQWVDVSGQWLHSGITAPATATLIQLQAPTNLSSLTSDPPEDLTVLRVVGDFLVTVTKSAAAGLWTLALMVVDVTWTPGATIAVDNDKRILWARQYGGTAFLSGETVQWQERRGFQFAGAGATQAVAWYDPEGSHIDIKPKVKIAPGKALVLAAYEEVNGATFSTSSYNLRVLYQRSGRR